jgi:two-component system response regulator CpxR
MDVLLIEADDAVWTELGAELGRGRYRLTRARTAAEAERLLAQNRFDLVVLDLMLPDADGLLLLSHVRTESDVPTIVLSRSQRRGDPVLALRIGADDVFRYPFVAGELEARATRVLLRRSGERLKRVADVQVGELMLDAYRGVATLHGRHLNLTPLDVRVLALMMAAPDRVVTHQELVERVWGSSEPAVSRRAEREIEGLRRKLRGLGPGVPSVQPVRLPAYRIVTGERERLAG